MAPFTVKTHPNTDIWRKPPTTNAFNARVQASPEHVNKPLRNFQRARVTVSAEWAAQYDQGGLVLHVTRPGIPCHGCDLNKPQDSSSHSQCKWLKSGIEYYNGETMIGTVCCDNYADWSLLPSKSNDVTIELQREKDKNGKGLWVHQILTDESGKEVRIPLREVAWLFALDDEWSVSVGAYACRPASEEVAARVGKGDGVLEVEVKEFDVEFA